MVIFFRVFFLLLLLSNHLSADIEAYGEGSLSLEEDKSPLFVSLGGTCHTALALRAIGLRKLAFPFDWFISTNHEKFLHIIDTDFEFFTDMNCFSQYKGVPCCINKYYNISFPHDFDIKDATVDDVLLQWDNFKAKYDKRIERFRSLRNYQGKVFFVRALWSSFVEAHLFIENTKRAQELRTALERYFPELDFTVVILSYPDLNIPEITGVEGVVELKIGRSHEELKNALDQLLSETANVSADAD